MEIEGVFFRPVLVGCVAAKHARVLKYVPKTTGVIGLAISLDAAELVNEKEKEKRGGTGGTGGEGKDRRSPPPIVPPNPFASSSSDELAPLWLGRVSTEDERWVYEEVKWNYRLFNRSLLFLHMVGVVLTYSFPLSSAADGFHTSWCRRRAAYSSRRAFRT